MAQRILAAGYSVVVDAAFLKQSDRARFHAWAMAEQVQFGIVDCQADEATRRNRIQDRFHAGGDASDADLSVLEQQPQNA